MAIKYGIENKLKEYLIDQNLDYVCLQGEAVGSVQGNPLKLEEDDLYIFNFIRSDTGRSSSIYGKDVVERKFGMKFVPILETNYYMPDDMEEFKKFADGKSTINPEVRREGLVLRDAEHNLSFKNVSREYLLHKKEH